MKIQPVGAELLYADGQEGGQRERHTYNEANSRSSQFLESALKIKERVLQNSLIADSHYLKVVGYQPKYLLQERTQEVREQGGCY